MVEEPADAEADLSVRGARGGGLVLLGSGASFAIQIASLLILSRLLSPSDFGVVAMVTIFVALGNLLRDFGLPLAGLQERSLSHQQASNLFWMSAVIAAVCSIVLVVSTPALVTLFHEPRLTLIVPALAVAVFLGGLTSQLQVHLARRMQFTVLVASDVIGQLVALAAAVALAIGGAGYWALVAQSLTAAFLTLLFRWVACRWMPTAPRRGHGAFRLLKTGATYGFAQMLTFAQSNVGTLLIGAQLGATQLGYYNRAYQLLTAPAGRLLDPLTQVVVTTLNRAKAAQRDPDELLFKIQFGVGTFIVWMFAVTAGTAPALIPLTLGDQWIPAVPIFQVLAAGGAVWVFNHVSYWAFIVKEKPAALLTYNFVSKPLAIASIYIGSHFGLIGVAWGYSAAMALSWPLNLLWLARTAGLPARRFLANGFRVLLAGAFAAATSAVTYSLLVQGPPLVTVAAGVLTGTAAMAAVLLALPASRALFADWIRLVRSSLLPRIKVGLPNA
ncbi:PST family polysaccharide transporter [Pseudarthrobacter sp. W1I19]|uniref:lipopolysaccharide biosynthesis protein n=1 Tax=Pseudarthrobacter sp. W1I19 TaxID=3042288 RepID=UPI002786E2DB|nr:lipopolysaccharide biosynthesis protein [Pseudarthrobacter sp. W1I19]MDQ0922308.1 PST family polysaccharide transporter [Pseudarthrobacter sp. W1I19]